MSAILFLGDEVTAAGFRMVGVDTKSPEPSQLAPMLESERARRDVIMLTTELAEHLPDAIRDRVLSGTDAVCVLLPDLRGAVGPMDLVAMVRRELGIEGHDG